MFSYVLDTNHLTDLHLECTLAPFLDVNLPHYKSEALRFTTPDSMYHPLQLESSNQ